MQPKAAEATPAPEASSSSAPGPTEYPEASVSAQKTTELGDLLELTYDKLNTEAIIDSVKDDGAGAIATFIGTTRNSFQGKFTRDPTASDSC